MRNLFKRILQLVEKIEKNSQTAFAKKIGWQQSTFNGYLNEEGQKKIRLALIEDILNTYQQVNRDWLMWGEGEMFGKGSQPKDRKRPRRVSSEIPFPNDPLGRIAQIVDVRTSSALMMQNVFGADFKELKKFFSRYTQARMEREAWEAAGGPKDDDDIPPALPQIPEEWLHYFWMNYGPNPSWIMHGEDREGKSPPLLQVRPQTADWARLNREITELRRENAELREKFGREDLSKDNPLPADLPLSALGTPMTPKS